MEMIVIGQKRALFVLLSIVCAFGLTLSFISCNKQETNVVCMTEEASEITDRTARLSGRAYLPSDLTGTILLGFLVSLQDNPSVGNSGVFKTNEIDQNGLFQQTISGLEKATKYYYRAYVLRNDIYVYGNILSFETTNDIRIFIKASAELFYTNGDIIRIDPILYEGFHHEKLSDNDLEDVFIDLTKHISSGFSSATLSVSIYDYGSRKHLRDEKYGVVYNSRTGHYDFAMMP